MFGYGGCVIKLTLEPVTDFGELSNLEAGVGDKVPVKIRCDVGDRFKLLEHDKFCTLLHSLVESGLETALT